MYDNLLDPEVQDFIRAHENDDSAKLMLGSTFVKNVATSLIADQIKGRQKAKLKLPSYYHTEKILYPSSVSLEQSTSEEVARIKIDLIRSFSNEPASCLDLTGGFGVDSFFLSKCFKKIIYVEPESDLLKIARHNHQQLGVTNIEYHNTGAEEFIDSFSGSASLIYIDPSRRADSKKVIRFANSNPNVICLLNQLFKKSEWLLIKASPMMDIQQAIKELLYVKRVFVVAIENDCKELLFLCHQNVDSHVEIKAIHHTKNCHHAFSFSLTEEENYRASFSEPKEFLYEPNAAILKSGAFKMVANRYQLKKVSANTHFYTADRLISDFPGRVFKITAFVKPDPKQIARVLPGMKANITTRNYPLTVAELKKKTKVSDGGDKFLIGFSSKVKKYLTLADRVY